MEGLLSGRVEISEGVISSMIAHCLSALPYEGCGLLVGELDSAKVTHCFPTDNLAHSSRLYTVDPKQHLRVDRDAEALGLAIIGVFHSHTHTDAYPSPTDVRQAPDPSWHYVLVSLRHEVPSTRSFRIVEGHITEEEIEMITPSAG